MAVMEATVVMEAMVEAMVGTEETEGMAAMEVMAGTEVTVAMAVAETAATEATDVTLVSFGRLSY
jgi:hypothetical protein